MIAQERMHNRQLFSLTPSTYRLPSYVDHDGRLHTRPADNLPTMIWPDGGWCSSANTFMRELLEKGLSRRNNGGTLAVAASHLTHLIRFCWRRNTDFSELTDNQFTEFVAELCKETKPRDPSSKRRDANSVIAIGRTCLSFLDSLARQSADTGLIGPEGRVRACLRTHSIKIPGNRGKGSTKTVSYWHHASLPNPDPKKKRPPISSAHIEDLRKAVSKVGGTPHLRARRHLTIKLLEVTGARRGEIALITTASVLNAAAMEHPMLHIPTLKKRGGRVEYRYVPVSRADLKFILQYVEVHRRAIVRRRLGRDRDHGLLLVSETTGDAFQPDSVTQDIRILAAAAGIGQKACPHMFRHRFITKLFVALIEHHSMENPDHFRKALLDGESLKRKVAEWTGHTSLDSLERYIQLAFDEVANFKATYDITRIQMALDSFAGILDAELEAIHAHEQPLLILDRLKDYVEQLKCDISAARTAPVPPLSRAAA